MIKDDRSYMAYFRVHSLASSAYLSWREESVEDEYFSVYYFTAPFASLYYCSWSLAVSPTLVPLQSSLVGRRGTCCTKNRMQTAFLIRTHIHSMQHQWHQYLRIIHFLSPPCLSWRSSQSRGQGDHRGWGHTGVNRSTTGPGRKKNVWVQIRRSLRDTYIINLETHWSFVL